MDKANSRPQGLPATQSVTVLGIDDAGAASLSPPALAAIQQAEVLAGGQRHLNFFPDHPGERIVIDATVSTAVAGVVEACSAGRRVVVLASGDPFLFGIGPALAEALGREHLRVVPNVSSVQLAFGRVCESWHDAVIMSAHGRPAAQLIPAALAAHKMAILTDNVSTPAVIARLFIAAGMEDCRAVVAERLGGERERVTESTLHALPKQEFDRLNVLLLLRNPAHVRCSFGKSEGQFESLKGQITKAEVRAIALSKLNLPRNGVLWDIGAGSGSLSIEAAQLAPRSQVFAVERDPDQAAIIERNIQRFGTTNVHLVRGEAPAVLSALPHPDATFVGGSGGHLSELLETLAPPLVLNVSLIQHLDLVLQRFPKAAVAQVGISRAAGAGSGKRLAALNPVFIISIGLENDDQPAEA